MIATWLNKLIMRWVFMRIVIGVDDDGQKDGLGIMLMVKPSSGWTDQPSGMFGLVPIIFWIT